MNYRYKVGLAFLLVILAVFCIYIYKNVNLGDKIVNCEFIVIVDKMYSKFKTDNRYSVKVKKLYGDENKSFDIFISDENVWNLLQKESSYFVVYVTEQNINKLRQIELYTPAITETSIIYIPDFPAVGRLARSTSKFSSAIK